LKYCEINSIIHWYIYFQYKIINSSNWLQLERSLTMTQNKELSKDVIHFPEILTRCSSAIRFLKFLGFYFQPDGSHVLHRPFVLLANNHNHLLLISSLDSLRELSGRHKCAAVWKIIFCRIHLRWENQSNLSKILFELKFFIFYKSLWLYLKLACLIFQIISNNRP